MVEIYIGCCGFPVSRDRYFKEFNVVELQNTFYNNPTPEEAERLRSSIPDNIVVTMKCWQVISHPPSSPTWKKLKQKLPGNIDNYGLLKPSKENIEAWFSVYRVAKILKARVIVIQTPPSLQYTEENFNNISKFFEAIVVPDVIIGWEPRGNWEEHRERIQRIIEKYNIVHISDILRKEPIVNKNLGVLYTRLHGLGEGEVNYRYRYTDQDLEMLRDRVAKMIVDHGVGEVYVMFNNVYMFDDAKRFKQIMKIVDKH